MGNNLFLLIFRISSSFDVEQAIVTQNWAALWSQLTNQRFREGLKAANSQIIKNLNINAIKETNFAKSTQSTDQLTQETGAIPFLIIRNITTQVNLLREANLKKKSQKTKELSNNSEAHTLNIFKNKNTNLLKEANQKEKVPKMNQFTNEKGVDTLKFFKHVNTNPIIESNQEKKSSKTKQFTEGNGTENLKIIKNINAYLGREAGPKVKSQKEANPTAAPKSNTLPSFLSPVSLKSGIAYLFIFQPVYFSKKVSSDLSDPY